MKTNKSLFLLVLLNMAFLVSFSQAEKDKFVIVLDAGHGGKDPGTNGNGFVEKDVALGFTLKVGEILEEHEDIEVIYTRKTDVFIPLNGRVEIANDAYANLFVSIHCNAVANPNPYGTETWVLGLRRSKDNFKVALRENSVIFLEDNYKVTYKGYDPNSPVSYIGMLMMQAEYLDQSIMLAAKIQDNFTNVLHRKNRGVKQGPFLVLRKTYMPSVLVETGFLSNNKEGAYMSSAEGQREISKAIARGILEYKNSIDLKLVEADENQKESRTAAVYEDIVFKVQLAASSNKLKTAPYNFKGLEDVSRNREDGLFKYYYGSTDDYLKIQELHREAKEHGFKTSYIVAFKDGDKITVGEALKTKIK